jgi:hypothetical protein
MILCKLRRVDKHTLINWVTARWWKSNCAATRLYMQPRTHKMNSGNVGRYWSTHPDSSCYSSILEEDFAPTWPCTRQRTQKMNSGSTAGMMHLRPQCHYPKVGHAALWSHLLVSPQLLTLGFFAWLCLSSYVDLPFHVVQCACTNDDLGIEGEGGFLKLCTEPLK